jgi:GNAT superfamily N-acetyltransferase
MTLEFIYITTSEDAFSSEARTIYEAAFDDFERVPFGSLLNWLASGENKMAGVLGAFLAGSQVVGMGSAVYFPSKRIGYLPYLAVKAGLRGQGYGREMTLRLLEWIRQCGLERDGVETRLAFWDVRDPADAPDEVERVQRHRRIRFYERLGAKALPIPYTFPPVAEGQPYVHSLLMGRSFQAGVPLTRADALDIAVLAIQTLSGNSPESPAWAEALEAIEAHWPA